MQSIVNVDLVLMAEVSTASALRHRTVGLASVVAGRAKTNEAE